MAHTHDRSSHAAPRAAGPGTRAALVLVEVTRGAIVESRHSGSAVVADRDGHVILHAGEFEQPVYPRSAVKPIQAIPLEETGAADAFGLGDAEIALACASHSGEALHTDTVAAWLERIGCSESDLDCGAQTPFDPQAAAALTRSGRAPSPLHNNCSGKHAGFLTTARAKGEPIAGYAEVTHPVQQRLLGVLEQMTGQDLSAAPRARDGCSIPTIAVSLGGLAVAMARFADPAGLPERRAAAVARIRRAWAGQPWLVGGRDRFDTAMITATQGRALTKGGAEGVHCACLPELGLGVALKIEDGAKRAAEVAMAAILHRLGQLDGLDPADAARFTRPPVRTVRGAAVGEIRPAPGFPA